MVNTIDILLAGEDQMLNPRSQINLRIAEYENRTDKKASQKELAAFLDVTHQHFNACVNSRAFLRMDKAFKLAKFLGCKVDDLYRYEEE